jgi:hypothetical protein
MSDLIFLLSLIITNGPSANCVVLPRSIQGLTSKYQDYFYDKSMTHFRVLLLGGDVEAILPNLHEQVSTCSYSSVSCSRLLCEVLFCCRDGKSDNCYLQQRNIIKFLTTLEKSGSGIYEMLKEGFGEEAMSHACVFFLDERIFERPGGCRR